MKKLLTTEAITSGHPDKMCDCIADAILDAYLSIDENSRVACEVCASKSGVLIMGEITSSGVVDIEGIPRKTIVDIGYDSDLLGFNGNTIPIRIELNNQSPDISRGVNTKEIGAGDQGIMYGYACDETDSYMPLVHVLACNLVKQLECVRKNKEILGLRLDGKAQVTLEYGTNLKVTTIVVSTQHDAYKDLELLKQEVILKVIKPVIPEKLLDKDTQILMNPTGRFVIGGPVGDSGLTGRKIIVDTYGGIAHHGGGAFSGKDYTKVDRSGAYYSRYVAKNLVASGICGKCEVSVSYAIGVPKPIAVTIDTFNTNKIPEEDILSIVNQLFDFSPANIIKELNLKCVKYQDTTLYSHFGKENLPWEKLDKVKNIQNLSLKSLGN